MPYILFASSMCFALGSGMTVKFFPLFFADDCQVGDACLALAGRLAGRLRCPP